MLQMSNVVRSMRIEGKTKNGMAAVMGKDTLN